MRWRLERCDCDQLLDVTMLENTNTYMIPKKLNKPSKAYRRKSFKPYGPNQIYRPSLPNQSYRIPTKPTNPKIPNLIFKTILTKSNQPNETSHTRFNTPNQTLPNQTLPNQTLPNQALLNQTLPKQTQKNQTMNC